MTGGGKHPHKAYCEKHSMEQKAKAESQKHGAEELKSLKHYRVELERLRLLCERIVKREKLKVYVKLQNKPKIFHLLNETHGGLTCYWFGIFAARVGYFLT
jgi:hypothetical protein